MGKNKKRSRKLRELRKLLHDLTLPSANTLAQRKMTYSDYIQREANARSNGSRIGHINDFIKKELISNPEIRLLVEEENQRLNEKVNDREIARRATQVTKDNQGVYVGGGGSNRNKIRYPKKNRSLRVWKKFYEMFPDQAELDGWDGKTSNKMKKS